jgi:hypothetical protein
MTYRQAIFAIKGGLKSVFDDSDISNARIAFFIGVASNEIIATHVSENDRRGAFLSIFDEIKVNEDSKGRKYINIPCGILNTFKDGGVEYISYNFETCCCEGPGYAQVNFQRTTAGELQTIYGDEAEKPSSKNPYFYLVGGMVNGVNVNRAYLPGLECVKVKDVQAGLFCSIDPSTMCDLDGVLPVPSEYESRLIKDTVRLISAMYGINEDATNDGSDSSESPSIPMEQQQQVNEG